MMRSNVLTLRTVKRNGENVLTLESDTDHTGGGDQRRTSTFNTTSLPSSKQTNPSTSSNDQLLSKDLDFHKFINEPVQLTSTIHDHRTTKESIMVDISQFPGSSEGDVAELSVPNIAKQKRILFVVKKLSNMKNIDDLQRRKVQISISNTIQNILELSTRSQVIVKLKNRQEAEADLVEIMVKDINLTRGDMWILSSSLNKHCVYKSQRLHFFESIRGNVSLIYKNGKKCFSGYIGDNTKVVFRSESATLLFLIQITEEMYHFQEDGEVMFHKVVNSLFPKIFKKWRERGTHHLITIVFAANVDFSEERSSWNDLKQGEVPQTTKDYFRVVVDQVNIVHWNEIMISLRYEFANFRKGIVKQQLKEGRRGHRFTPALKSDILNSIKLSTSLIVDRLKDPDLKHTTTHFIVISAGNGLYDVDYDELLDVGKRILQSELSVDIICLTQPPLHITPLFRYRDKQNDVLHHVVPGWIDVSFWSQEDTFRAQVQWLPRCKMYELQMMGVMEKEMNDVTVGYLKDAANVNDFDSVAENMNNYDKACFLPPSTKNNELNDVKKQPIQQLNQSMIWKATSNLTAVTKAEEVTSALSAPTFINSVSNSAINALQQIGKPKKEPVSDPATSSGSGISFFRPSSSASKVLEDSKSIRTNRSRNESSTTMNNNSPTSRPSTTPSSHLLLHHHHNHNLGQNPKSWLLQNHKEKEHRISNISSIDSLKQIMYTEIDNPSRKLDNETLQNLSVGKWQDVFPQNIKPSTIKWRSLLTPSDLPITTPRFPSLDDFEHNFTFQTHMISLSAEREAYMTLSDLMRDMIHVRLMLGWQICYGDEVEKVENNSNNTNNTGVGAGSVGTLMKYFPMDGHLEAGAKAYLSIDDEIHRISYSEYDRTINVQRYSRSGYTKSLISNKFNDILIRTRYQHNYHIYSPDPRVLNPRAPNWNQYDQLLAGYDDYVDFEDISVHRMKFVLLPCDIPKSTAYLQSSSATDEQLDPEETRVEGLRRLIMTLNRGAFQVDGGASGGSGGGGETRKRSKSKGAKEEIFPEISFYTGDLITFLKEDNKQTDVNVVENSSLSTNSTLEELEAEFRGPKGLKLQDRKWHFKVHKNCFRGTDLVSWLIENLQDVNTRDEGVAFGNQLMQKNIVVHVENRHKFLDGHYFYRLKASIATTTTTATASATASASASASAAHTPSIQPDKTKSEASSEFTKNNANNGNSKPFILSRSLRYDLDPKRKSYKRETIRVHYDTVHNPNHCYHIRLEWLTATAKLIDDNVHSWSRMCERYGLKLVEMPWNELCEIPKLNPYHSYVDIQLAINPWTDKLFYDEKMMATNKFYYHTYLLEHSGFLMDNRASLFFKDGLANDSSNFGTGINPSDEDGGGDLEILYSWGKPTFKYAQYIHVTGAYIAELRDTGDLFLAPNNTHIARVNINSTSTTTQQPSELQMNQQTGMDSMSFNEQGDSTTTTTTASSSAPGNVLDSQKIMLEFRQTCFDRKKLMGIFIQARNEWINGNKANLVKDNNNIST